MNRRSFLGLCAGAIAASAFPTILIPANGGRITPVRLRFIREFDPATRPRLNSSLIEELKKRFEEVSQRYVDEPVDSRTLQSLQTDLARVATELQMRGKINTLTVQPADFKLHDSSSNRLKTLDFTARIVPTTSLEQCEMRMSVLPH